ncbi:hypothetical protein BBP40_003585 [Aspergillus hancockii]|nr:hypothetical protein BBP40_003585 [Aspergillus hancockii]
MTRRSTINNSSVPVASTPSISRSTINNCSFSELSSALSISRSDLDTVNIFRKTVPEGSSSTAIPPSSTAICRSTLNYCILANAYVRRSRASSCEFIDVSSAKSMKAHHSKFENVGPLRRSYVMNSTVMGRSMLNRSKVKGSSVTDASSLRRSDLEDVQLSQSRVKKSVLRDCDVSNCMIIKSDFTGMVLRNGVWKNGKLVGRMGENEVVAMTRDGQNLAEFSSEQIVTQDAKVWADNDPDSDSSDKESVDSQDLPPPYRP